MDNSSRPLFCPLLASMKNHSLNNNNKVNLAVVCVHGLVSCLGILENALILWVVGFRLRRRTVASVWVLNLALSDFLATLTLPLFTHYFHSSHSWVLGSQLCSAQASLFFLNMFVSAFLLAAISLDRCLLVTKPVWSQNHRSVAAAWKVCALGWLWGAVNTFPYFMFRAVTDTVDGRKLCYHNFALYATQATLDRDCKVRQAATAISKLLLAFLGPLAVIAGSYVLFGHSLGKRKRKRENALRLNGALIMTSITKTNNVTKTPNTPKKQPGTGRSLSLFPTTSSKHINQGLLSRSFTKMVASVITAFVLCWAPYHIFCLVEVVAQSWPQNLSLVEVGLPIATTFAFLNPVLNPILYAFSCPHFCERIQQSLGAVFEGLVEEGGGITTGMGRKAGARKGSQVSSVAPASPNCRGSLHSLHPSSPSSPYLVHDPRICPMDKGWQDQDDGLEQE